MECIGDSSLTTAIRTIQVFGIIAPRDNRVITFILSALEEELILPSRLKHNRGPSFASDRSEHRHERIGDSSKVCIEANLRLVLTLLQSDRREEVHAEDRIDENQDAEEEA